MKKESIITLIVLSVIALIIGSFFAYKYYNFPRQSVIHCYSKLGEKESMIDYYYLIKDNKIINTLELSKTNSSISSDKLLQMQNSYDEFNEYKGYLNNLVLDNGLIYLMDFYDYRYLNDEMYTYAKMKDKNFINIFSIDDATKVNIDDLKNQGKDIVCY